MSVGSCQIVGEARSSRGLWKQARARLRCYPDVSACVRAASQPPLQLRGNQLRVVSWELSVVREGVRGAKGTKGTKGVREVGSVAIG